MIRKANLADVANVNAIYDEHFENEAQNGSFSNWKKDLYPTFATAENACKNGWLYVLEEDGEICASIIFNHVQPCEYQKIAWETVCPDSESLTLHTLCVSPAKKGRGYGRALVEYGLALAKAEGCKVLRLDTYEGNKPAQSMYKKLGFHFAGSREVDFEGIPETLFYYEHVIV